MSLVLAFLRDGETSDVVCLYFFSCLGLLVILSLAWQEKRGRVRLKFALALVQNGATR